MPGIAFGMAATEISACLFCGCLCLCVTSWTVLVCIFDTFILSNSFASVRLLMTAYWALCTSTLLAQANTFSLVTVPFSFTFVSSHIIFPSKSVSFKLCMKLLF